MTEHTKGPWEWQRNQLCFADCEQGELISPHATEPVITAVTAVATEWWLQVRPANARLIAAAPIGADLAQAVLEWWDEANDGQPIPVMVRLAEQFKAKAEGKE